MSETRARTPEERTASTVAYARRTVGQPGACWCSGVCMVDGVRVPERCPAYGHENKTFNDLIEESARIADRFDPEYAGLLRAAKDPA
jgi:hypothetical protein